MAKKTNDQKIEKLTEDYAKNLASLHLRDEFDDSDLEPEDLDAIVDLALHGIEEISRTLLSSCAIGYLGNIMGLDVDSESTKLVLVKA